MKLEASEPEAGQELPPSVGSSAYCFMNEGRAPGAEHAANTAAPPSCHKWQNMAERKRLKKRVEIRKITLITIKTKFDAKDRMENGVT
jgi:hypothetical protein